MKKLLTSLFLLLFIVGINAQQQLSTIHQNPVKLNNNFTKLNVIQPIVSKTKTKSLISDQFISKAGGTCVDTLLYPYYKESINAQVNSTTANFYFQTISDSSSTYGVADMSAQVYKTGTTPMTINGVFAYIGKGDNQVGQTVQVKVSVYKVVSGAPTTEIGSTIYTFTNELLEFKTIPFSTPVTVNTDFAIVIKVVTLNKVVKVVISDNVYNAALDEGLAYFNVPGFLNNLVQVYDTYFTQLGTQVDYDYILSPIISYDVDMTLAATPNPVCLGNAVTLKGTVTPTGINNRFTNWQTFLDYFSFTVGATPYTSAPLGLIDQSIILTGNNVSHIYTTAATYDAYMEFESGLKASCYANNTTSVTVNAPVSAAFSFNASNFCQSSTSATPSITTAGGVFSTTPSTGLSINTSTGKINFATSTPNTYTVKYTVTNGACSDTKTTTINVAAALNAAFSYASNSYCTNGPTTAQITLGAGATAGTFSVTPAGLSINSSTGEINIATSSAGSYVVKNTVNASAVCTGDSKTFTLTIVAAPDATITYAGTNFCQGSPASTPSITTSGGTFSASPSGLSINSSTGLINFGSSTVASYVVQYVVANGSCTDTKTANINVVSALDASFSYANNSYCVNGSTNPQIALGSLSSAGIFTATPVGLNINSTTGEIDLASSNPDTYIITNTVSASGGCIGDAKTFTVTIKALPIPTIAPVATVCENDNIVTLNAAPAGGTFSGNGVANGFFNPATAGSGAHTITYMVTENGCSASVSTVVQVDALPSVTFTIPATTCVNYSPIALTATPNGGTFTGAGVVGNSFDPSIAGAGSHSIVYTIGSGACTATKTNTIMVDACLAIENADMIQVNLFPIPTENELTIIVNTDVEVQVLSIDGKLLIAPFKVANQENYVLNTQTFARGVYLLKLTTDNGFEKVQRIMLK